MKSFYVCLAFSVIVAVSSMGVPAPPAGVPGNPDCEDCNAIILRFIESYLKPQLTAMMPYEVKLDQGPCQICNFTQIDDLEVVGDVCSQKFDTGYRQTIRILLKSAKAKCDCNMKPPIGNAVQFGVDGSWSNGRVVFTLQIMGNKCTVVNGGVDCDNPQPKCMIDKSTVDVACEASSPEAKDVCEKQKDGIMVNVMQMLGESTFPAIANDEVNKRPKVVDMVNCEDVEL